MLRFAARASHPWSPPGWIWVIVHDTREQLREAAARYNGHDATETEACFQGREFRVQVDDDGKITTPADRYAGVLRILPEHGIATVAHEVTHAALAIYSRQHAIAVDILGDIDEHEEPLCYLVGDLIGTITSSLYKHGVWEG